MPDSISLERLQEVLDYDAATDVFRRKTGIRAGEIAGWDCRGYTRIEIDGERARAHRLAWLWVNGEYPRGPIDHINGDRSDNRISNLREATLSQNAANQRTRSDNASGLKGVSWREEEKLYVACIRMHGKSNHLGYFKTAEAAHRAYCEAAKQTFGEFARFA